MQPNSLKTDLLIVGGSYAGLCLGIAVKQYRPNLNIKIIDARSQQQHLADEKSHAIAPDCVKMLEKLQIWPQLRENAEAILKMEITDSRLEELIRPNFLQLEPKADLSALAYMIETRDFMPILYARASALGINISNQCRLESFTSEANYVEAKLANGTLVQSKLLIAADGKYSRLRAASNIKSYMNDYKKTAIVCTVKHERPHNGVAIQHFLPAGPFAILPLKHNRSSLVWTEDKTEAQRLIALNEANFLDELTRRFGHFLGHLELGSAIQSFPLALILPYRLIDQRFMLLGDAAHAIHPLCGQGLNLGLRDCATAAQIIVETARLGLDIGSFTQLEKYQAARRPELVSMGFSSHLLHQLFANDYNIIRHLRDMGLYLVNKTERIKNYFINQATGQRQNKANLLQGKDI